jgi:hypothetical protein
MNKIEVPCFSKKTILPFSLNFPPPPPHPTPPTPLFMELTEEDKALGSSLQLEELNVCWRSKIHNI